jgi:hypothetical protein
MKEKIQWKKMQSSRGGQLGWGIPMEQGKDINAAVQVRVNKLRGKHRLAAGFGLMRSLPFTGRLV